MKLSIRLAVCLASMLWGALAWSPASASTIPASASGDARLLWRLVMESYYGPYDRDMKCWRARIDHEALCMRPHRLDRVSVGGVEHLFLAIGGVTLDGEGRPREAHVDTGALGLVILKVDGKALKMVAKNDLHAQIGSFGNVPAEELFEIRQIGPNDSYGWVITHGWTGQGHMIQYATIFTAIGDRVVPIGEVGAHYDNGGNCENNTIIGSNTPCTDYSSQLLFDSADASSRFYPLILKVTGSREGNDVGKTYRTTFDGEKLSYGTIQGLPEEFANGI